jgi:sentrin-specific protease 7
LSTDEKDQVIIPRSSSQDRRPSARGRLKDILLQSAQDAGTSKAAPRLEENPDLDLRRSTRSSAPATRQRLPSPDAWSKSHPDWEESWVAPLIFPETGKNRATVDKIDIPRLNESEFLNDNLINFYIRHLQFRLEKERPELLRKVYFFSTFFFEKLKSTKGKINYDGVKAWTARVDLLSYDYIFVPVNEHTHWYLAIICNLPNAVRAPSPEEKDPKSSDGSVDNAMEMIDAPESPRLATVERDLTDISLEDVEAAVSKDADGFVPSHRTATPSTPSSPPRKRKSAGSTPSKFDPTQPRIITLDSLGSPHAPTIKALKEYLVEEAKAKKGITLETIPTGMTARGIPEQNNFCDCGVFVLGYMEEFLINPDEAARKLFSKEELGWNIRPSDLRNQMRELLFKLQDEQQKRHLQQREDKKLLKAKRKAMTESSSQISSPPKPVASPSPAPKLPGSFPSESPERKPMSGAEPSSSEYVQEADKLKDSDLNGETLHEDEQRFKALSEPQFISCLSDASGASPTITKGKIPPIASTKTPEEPQFIGCLSEGESVGSNIPKPKDKIPPSNSSLASKRNGYYGKLVVELKAANRSDKSQFEESILDDDEDDSVQFIMQQSSASSENNEATSKPKKTSLNRQSSVELIGETRSRPTSSHMHDQRTKPFTSTLARLKARKDAKSDVTRRGPRYEGIDRSAAIS